MVEKLSLIRMATRLFGHDESAGDDILPETKPAAAVTIYTTMFCPYCMRAKKLLRRKGVAFEEIAVDGDVAKRTEMVVRSNGGRTVPQIFINGRHIGGSDELADLERAGTLDSLLAVAP